MYGKFYKMKVTVLFAEKIPIHFYPLLHKLGKEIMYKRLISKMACYFNTCKHLFILKFKIIFKIKKKLKLPPVSQKTYKFGFSISL